MATITLAEPLSVAAIRSDAALASAYGSYSIAVEGLLFDGLGRWVLMERGGAARDEVGKLEGIGGRAEGDGDLRDELRREFVEEIGSQARIEIVSFLELKSDVVQNGTTKRTWVIASYLCKHVSGDLQIAEPEKNLGFVYVADLAVDPSRLSSSCQQSLRTLQEQWPAVRHEFGLG